MSDKCPYTVTRSGDHIFRCNRAIDGRLLCAMHTEVVLKVLDAVNDELIAALRKYAQ